MFEESSEELKFYQEHLKSIEDPGTRIAPIFVGHVLTIAHAQFEEAVKNAIKERCTVKEDAAANSYVVSTVDNIVRSIKVTELSGYLGRFGGEYKSRFAAYITSNQETIVYYNNLESNRQSLAHKGVVNATMDEVLLWFAEAQSVIVEFRETLGLSNSP